MERRVYVIELDQPFLNWYGELKTLGAICEVEDDNGGVHQIPAKYVQDAETGKPIFEQINYEQCLLTLTKRGLTDDEAKTFLDLLDKVKLTQEDINAFESEMNEGIPFEGGMSFSEALTALKNDN